MEVLLVLVLILFGAGLTIGYQSTETQGTVVCIAASCTVTYPNEMLQAPEPLPSPPLPMRRLPDDPA